ANWNPELPSPPNGFWEETTIGLRPVEAEFLADRILLTNKWSLLGHFLLHPDRAIEQARYPWDLSAISTVEEPIRTWLHHAHLFSVVMHGAAWTYNLLLARLAASRRIGPASA